MAATDTVVAPAITDQQQAALGAFVALVVADLNPTLRAITMPVNGEAEYEIVVNGRGMSGVRHDEIYNVLRIAEDHGGRAFVHHADQPREGCLCIVWGGRS